MAELLAAAKKAHSHIKGSQDSTIDNWTFKLFYQYTTSILMISSILVTTNQLFGNPIQCDLPGASVSGDTLRNYCWMYGTFNIPLDFQGNCAKRVYTEDKVFNTSYQWVSLCLVGQALVFYLPRAIWLSMEGGLIQHLSKDKTGKVIEDGANKCEELVTTFNEHLRNKYNRYFSGFIGCELLNLVIIITQIFLTDRFIGEGFLSYGPDVYIYYRAAPEENHLLDRPNPMCQVFPRVASCTYYHYGGGGEQTSLNALCILALNIIIDKIYLILWWWYLFLVLCAIFRIIERIIQFSSGSFRFHLMKFRMRRYFKDCSHTQEIRSYLMESSYGDWFVLYQMSKNINKSLFWMFLTSLAETPKCDPLIQECTDPFLDRESLITSSKKKLKPKDDPTKPVVINVVCPTTASSPSTQATASQECSRRRGHDSDEDDDNTLRYSPKPRRKERKEELGVGSSVQMKRPYTSNYSQYRKLRR